MDEDLIKIADPSVLIEDASGPGAIAPASAPVIPVDHAEMADESRANEIVLILQ